MSSGLNSSNLSDEAQVLLGLQVGGSLVEHVSCPSASALSKFLAGCDREGKHILAGRPRNLPSRPAQKINYFLTLDGADRVLEHCRADQVISVEAGISIAALQAELAKHKQWFPVYVQDVELSLMDFINSGSTGCLEHGFGEARDLVLGMQVVLANGELIKCGGKVVKNVTGYDLPKLFSGAQGSLGLPCSAHLRLYALPETSSTLLVGFESLSEGFKSAKALCRSGLPLSCLEIVDPGILRAAQSKGFNIDLNLPKRTTVILLAEIHGIASVVAELENEFKQFAGSKQTCFEKLSQDASRFLWALCSNPKEYLQTDYLELAAPLWLIEKLLVELTGADHDIVFSARPGRHKAYLACSQELSNVEDIQELAAERLQKLIADFGFRETSCLLSYSDYQYLKRVRVLPHEDLVLRELKRRIKNEFDPNSTLNPLVLL